LPPEEWFTVTDLPHPAEPVIVRLPAEIDLANAENVGEQLRSAFTRGAAVVIADLTSTVFCDSAGARQLVLSHNYADFHDAQVRFAIPNRNMLRVLDLTGIDQLLSIYPSLDAALSAGPVPDGDAASG
jgi:anti-sigma B factor antagonist